jgi:hypothetical protein
MKRAWWLVALAPIGCAPIQTDVRTERGPTLGMSTRESVTPNAGVQVGVEPRYPELTLSFERFDACKSEKVETYAEERITEKSAPGGGPALASGISSTLAGGILFALAPVLSNAPNTSRLDESGRYGPSPRQLANAWGVGLLALGVPAVIAGSIELARSGVNTETRKVDQVVGSNEVPCHLQPVSGQVQLLGMPRQLGPRAAVNGKVTLRADELKDNAFESIALDDRPATMSESEAMKLDSFFACTQVLPPSTPAPNAEAPTLEQLRLRKGAAEQCDRLPDHPAQAEEARLAKELSDREAAAPKPPAPPQVVSFDQALQVYPPKLTLAPDSPDLARLSNVSELIGTPVLVEGVLMEHEGSNIVVVRVGELNVLVFIEPQSLWATDFPIGARVEAVAVVMGTQQLGELSAPLVRAIWMRTGIAPKSP